MNMMPAGTYYVGDLCYVLSSRWDEFCELTIDGSQCLEGIFTMADGTRFATFGTAWGDGTYFDQEGNSYSVDAGLIGCVLVSQHDTDEVSADLGAIHTFTSDFPVHSDGKRITFGRITIDTDPEVEEDDYEYYDDDEE